MNEEINLEINRLRDLAEFEKFKYGQFSYIQLGLLAILVAIFIPVMLSLRNLVFIIFSGLSLLTLFLFVNLLFKKTITLSGNKVKKYYGQINQLHTKLANFNEWNKEHGKKK